MRLLLLLLLLGNHIGAAAVQEDDVLLIPEKEGMGRTRTNSVVTSNATSERKVRVLSPMAGRIKSILFYPGQAFQIGAALIEFDCDKAISKAQDAEISWRAADQLFTANVQSETLGMNSNLEVMLASVIAQSAKLRLERDREQLAHCQIRAQIAGRVKRVHAKLGQEILTGQPVLDFMADK